MSTKTDEIRRIDPKTGLIYLQVAEKGSAVTIRPLGSPDERTITFANWMTWDRHRWPVNA